MTQDVNSPENGKPEVVKLSDLEKSFDLVESEFHLRRQVVDSILPTFNTANVTVLALIVICLIVDIYEVVHNNTSYERIIDGKVVMAVIGATTVQLGILVVTIGNYLFPKRDK